MIFVPGRIEVLGKHTDYAGGRSLVCATERGFRFEYRRRLDAVVAVTDAASAGRVEIRLDEALPTGVRVRADPDRPATHAWAAYPAAVVLRLASNFPDAAGGADIVFRSDLPPAAGLSSSSALMIGVFLALSAVRSLERHDAYRAAIASREDLAAYLAAVENGSAFGPLAGDEGVGTMGGSEDHTAILCCRAQAIAQYTFAPLAFERAIDLPPGLTFVVANSGVAAEKTGPARAQYNRAAATAARVLAAWQAAAGSADASLGDVVRSAPDAADWVRKVLTPADLLDRFNHFVEESETLVPAAGEALAAGDLAMFGRLCDRSQALAERLLHNQVPETVALARIARQRGAHAASAFGAGFGGSVWALVDSATAPAFAEAWLEDYRAAFPDAGRRASTFATRPAGPAREI